MKIETTQKDGVAVLAISGRLDLASGTKLKEKIKEYTDRQLVNIHLNLATVEFINSSGLGALVSIMKEIRLLKGRLTLSNLAGYVQEIFDITQLSHIFEIFNTEEEALNSYQPATTE